MTIGYWEPHSASIEFCEPNYVVTTYVTEIHNAWSSLFMTFIAIIGFAYGNPYNELKVSMMYLALGIIGLGSTALHSTLNWIWQSVDEVPMLWQALTLVYFLTEIKSEIGMSSKAIISLLCFLIVGFFQTYFYYCNQKMFVVFLVSIIFYAITIASWSGYLLLEECNKNEKKLRQVLYTYSIISFAFGSVLWIIDMNFCDFLLPYYNYYPKLGGITLHVLWHIGAGLGVYVVITYLVLIRMQKLSKDVYVKWILGFLPVCRLANKKKE